MMRSIVVAFTISLLAGGAAARTEPGFARGVNLSHWLQYDGRQPVAAADMQMLAAAGFDHVRIPFDPVRLGWRPEAPDPEMPLPQGAQIESAVAMALVAGLRVIVDFHPDARTEEMVEGKPAVRQAFLDLWRWLATRLARQPADRVAYQILNEPQYYGRGATAWNALQARAVKTLRSVAPNNLILLSGIHGSDIDALERTAIVADRHACYVFHFYDPQLLTHLGADWDPYPDRAQGMMRGLVYPAAEMTMAKVELRPGARINVVSDAVRRYLNEGWNAERIAERIDIARSWAARNGVCLQATEFGALRGVLGTPSRLRWIADVRRALEDAGVGWTIWDYADLFGIATTAGAVERVNDATTVVLDPRRFSRSLDPLALVALGLDRGSAP
jgi:endoglucanase